MPLNKVSPDHSKPLGNRFKRQQRRGENPNSKLLTCCLPNRLLDGLKTCVIQRPFVEPAAILAAD